jgi:hypothetical protein
LGDYHSRRAFLFTEGGFRSAIKGAGDITRQYGTSPAYGGGFYSNHRRDRRIIRMAEKESRRSDKR